MLNRGSNITAELAADHGLTIEEFERAVAILGHTPMERFGRPEELVGAVLWLASDSASFVTGSVIAVDGGFTAMTI